MKHGKAKRTKCHFNKQPFLLKTPWNSTETRVYGEKALSTFCISVLQMTKCPFFLPLRHFPANKEKVITSVTSFHDEKRHSFSCENSSVNSSD